MKMNRKLAVVGILIIVSLIAWIVPAAPVLADPAPTTSLTITKYASDRTTVLASATVTYQELMTGSVTKNGTTYSVPVQGDGVTHYYTQGPTFVPTNIWDPDETLNLKDKGALKGTDIKDLCALVGGANPGDTIKPVASDGYGNDEFPWENVYNPDSRQGKMVICWFNANVVDEDTGETLTPGYVPNYSKGMLLAFFAQTQNAAGKYVFGHQDMHDCLPEANWHWYSSGSTNYASTNGLYAKYVAEIKIYSSPAPQWSINMAGAYSRTVSEREFENGAACHSPTTGNPYSYTEGSNTWTGIPLWYLLGYVDDTTVIHGIGAFNDALAEAGYTIIVKGKDGSGNPVSAALNSASVSRNNSILIANKVNGAVLPAADLPLKLVGDGITNSISQITEIELAGLPAIPQWTLDLFGSPSYAPNYPYTMHQSEYEDALICSAGHATVTIGNYSGLSLAYLAGWIDDDKQHGEDAFNDDLGAAGYSVRVTNWDNVSYTLPISSFTGLPGQMSQPNAIIANRLNGQRITSPDPDHPLKLVGSGAFSAYQLDKVYRIELVNMPSKITASSGPNGAISPSGTAYVAYQGSQTYTFIPDTGYKVASVTIDGTALTGTLPTSYEFTNVEADHTIAVTFAVNAPYWDLNGDHVCTVLDISSVARKIGQTGSPGWIIQDIDKNGSINVLDISAVARKIGQTW
jgi:hypothetical protein